MRIARLGTLFEVITAEGEARGSETGGHHGKFLGFVIYILWRGFLFPWEDFPNVRSGEGWSGDTRVWISGV